MLPIIRHIERNFKPVSHRSNCNGFSRLLDDVFSDSAVKLQNFGSLDLYEDDKNVYVEVELPGCERKDAALTLEDGMLHINASRSEEKEVPKTNYYVRERVPGTWSRSVRLPEDVQEDKIEATFKNGVLKVTMEKPEQSKPHKIEIK